MDKLGAERGNARWRAGVGLLVAMIAVSACQSSSPTTAPAASSPAAASVPAASVPAASGPAGSAAAPSANTALTGDLAWWGWTPTADLATTMIAAFNQVYPNVKVTFVSKPIDSYDSVLGPALTSSKGPDVFNVAPGSLNGGVSQFAPGAIDMTPAITASLGADWKSKVAPAGVDPMTVDGKLVGLQVGAVYSGWMWINQDIFDQNGLKAPTTMAEWQTVCSTLQAKGQGCFVQGAGQWAFDMDTYEAIMENIEPDLYTQAADGKVKWTDPRFVQGMQNWKALFDQKIMQDGAAGLNQYPDANNLFLSGKYAMVMMGSWYTSNTVKDTMVNGMTAAGVSNPTPITIMPIPFPDLSGSGKTGTMFGDADYGLAVSAKSSQQEAATAFATWISTSQPGQQVVANTLNLIPALKGVSPQWDQIALVNPTKQLTAMQDYQTKAVSSISQRLGNVSADLNTAFRDALIGVATGQKTPDEAVQILQAVQDAGK
jgi:raffinose/stachyose/melibiose transport system substrate-binding protein